MAGQRVLIVEDDEEIAGALARTLSREGYDTACTGTVAGALALVADEHWDAVLLDLGLPDGDGLEVARELRATNAIPVLVVTARDEVSSRVAGLDAGADDYLVKPFDRSELLARLRALLRRSAPAAGADPTIEVADLVIDQGRRSVRRGNRAIATTPLEFELLVYLGRRGGAPGRPGGAPRARVASRPHRADEHGRGVRLEPAPQARVRWRASPAAYRTRLGVRARCVVAPSRSGGAWRC